MTKKEKVVDINDDKVVTDNGDYYFSINGSYTEGFTVQYYRKIGWNSVTSEYKTLNLTHVELVEFLNDRDNLMRYESK